MGITYPICIDCEYMKETQKELCKFPNDRANPYCRKRTCSGFKMKTSIVDDVVKHINANYKFWR